MTISRFQELFNLCIAGNASTSEREEFLRLVELPKNEDLSIELITDTLSREENKIALTPTTSQEIVQSILATENISSVQFSQPAHRVHFLRRGFFRYAAAIILIAGAGTVAVFVSSDKQPNKSGTELSQKVTPSDIPPGGERAVLTLADGRTIALDSAANGQLASQGGVKVVKLANGKITYDLQGLNSKESMWNTMSTPKGGQYQVVLPDGTKVWLNASSAITFPTA